MNYIYNWEETIEHIRTLKEFKGLVELAYLEKDLSLNVERYIASDEYKATLIKIKEYAPNAQNILDVGCGNGISSIAFALAGYNVTAVEPDPSETIGAGAIRALKEHYKLTNIEIYEAYAEDINFNEGTFDIAFARQCMHHAYDLKIFVLEMAKVLKTKGMFFTVRDHVVFNMDDKEWFLECHPLQKFYGGENAFTPSEYKDAITESGLLLKEELKYYDTVINYFPESQENIEFLKRFILYSSKYGCLISLIPYFKNRRIKFGLEQNEKKIPGRMYSYIAIKS